jgi:hypothetical protein
VQPPLGGFAIALILAGIGLTTATADESDNSGVFGNLRLGFIEAEDAMGVDSSGSAIGGKLGYVSPRWKGLSAGATFYTTQETFDDENGDFFSSENDSYAILGEAYLRTDFGNSMLKLGRFEFDSPHADTDDVRMIPNTFQGGLLTNRDLPDTTLIVTHLHKWSGVDSDIPEDFQALNSDEGITALGMLFEGIENLPIQGWFYHGDDFADLFYLEAVYEIERFHVGAQYGSQSDETSDDSGPDGDVYGFFASIDLSDFMLMAAYNDVSGIVINGFGGGPYFTSADDHTIDGTEDQEALALNAEYSGIKDLVLGLWHVDFDQGEDETDYYATYNYNEQYALELIYTDMRDDGDFIRLMANYYF